KIQRNPWFSDNDVEFFIFLAGTVLEVGLHSCRPVALVQLLLEDGAQRDFLVLLQRLRERNAVQLIVGQRTEATDQAGNRLMFICPGHHAGSVCFRTILIAEGHIDVVAVILLSEGIGNFVLAVPAGTETGIATDGEGADVANFAAVAGFLVVIEAAVGGVVLANLDWIQRLELALVTHFIVSIFVEQGARIKRRTFSWRVIEVQCATSPLTIKVAVTQLKVITHEIVRKSAA